jgi:hypothetical protein
LPLESSSFLSLWQEAAKIPKKGALVAFEKYQFFKLVAGGSKKPVTRAH